MNSNRNNMQKILSITLVASLALFIASCGGGAKDEKAQIGDMKAKVEKLKKDKAGIDAEINQLEEKIAKADPTAASVKEKLVSVTPIGSDTFTHYIELQGKIDAQNVAYAAPRNGTGGLVRSVHVKQGDVVRKGQLLLKLDDALQRQGVAAAEQGVAQARAGLDQAQSLYKRQQNLWKENIGTEVQVLNAKTNVDALQAQLNAAQAQLRSAQEQVAFTNVTAEISGTVNVVNVRAGEIFTAQAPTPQIQIVNTGDLKVLVQVPENYQDRVGVGNTLVVTFPELGNKTISTKVTVAGKLIDPVSRSFYVEGKLPQDKSFRPNQIANVRIRDYSAPNAVTIPVNTIQNDEKGKYVMVAVKEGNKLIARKRQVVIGQLYGEKLEVKSGLQSGDMLVTDGFQNLYEGQPITTTAS